MKILGKSVQPTYSSVEDGDISKRQTVGEPVQFWGFGCHVFSMLGPIERTGGMDIMDIMGSSMFFCSLDKLKPTGVIPRQQ